jgi:hypothetical protein
VMGTYYRRRDDTGKPLYCSRGLTLNC